MERVNLGDTHAFAQLYDRHRSRLFSYVARLTQDRGLAEELLQETFLRVWRRRREYRASGRFPNWLFTIARRLVIDDARKQANEVHSSEVLDALPAPDRTEAVTEASDLLARLEKAIERLPPGQREVLLLSRVAGLGAEDIADVVGSTPGAVRVALHRALKQLRGSIDE
jgi:RNA polymerase sigma-70 factor (ECF subfamily)